MIRSRHLMMMIFCLKVCAPLHAFGESSAGTASGQILKMGGSARAMGMGEAYSAVADSAEAITWNPAGLGFVNQPSITLMHAVHLKNFNYDYVSCAHALPAGTLGTSLQYFASNDITQTDPGGNIQGSFKLSDTALSLGYGRTFKSLLDGRLAAGFSGKWVRSKIIESAQAGAVDGGVLWQVSRKTTIGFAIQNLFGNLNYKSNAASLPLNFKWGSAYRFSSAFMAAFDLNIPKDNRPNAAVGSEYKKNISPAMEIAGRAGYQSRTGSGLGGISGVSLGLGLAWKKTGLDFAWAPFGDLGNGYRVSITHSFGSSQATPHRKNSTAKAKAPLAPQPVSISAPVTVPTPTPSVPASKPIAPPVSALKNSKRDDQEWKKIAAWKSNLSAAETPESPEKLEQNYAEAAALMEKRKLDEAVDSWKRLLEAAPDYKDAPTKLAATLMARAFRHSFSGNHVQSVRDFEEALKLTPDDENLKKFLEDEKNVHRRKFNGR